MEKITESCGIILQARMGSKRLPGKIFKPIGDKSLLEHIIFRITFMKYRVPLIIATSNSALDDVVENFCGERGIECFRGSEENVLERYYLCAKKYGFLNIIRLTGDNPFVDIEELDRLIALHYKIGADFTYSFESLPLGVGAEIFKFNALEKTFFQGKAHHHMEHVDEYMLENPQIFRTVKLEVKKEKNRPDVRLTVDTEEDYERACYIVDNATHEFITTEEAIQLCLQFA